MIANKDGEMSCSTCHQSFIPIDRETPRTTCAACHNGNIDDLATHAAIRANTPNCTSCHVQHVEGRRTWGTSLLAREAVAPPVARTASQSTTLLSRSN